MSDELYNKIKTADINPSETQEWLAAIDNVLQTEGQARATFLLDTLIARLQHDGYALSSVFNPDYINTIPVEEQPEYAGDLELEKKLRAAIRWNAAAMVVRAGKIDPSLGGHIATYASSSTLYNVGFNHYFRGAEFKNGGDCVYFQGHASPGIYARSFLEGRLSQEQLEHFRREIDGKGISSYPHPYLMPDYWQFPTVSMGLGPLQAIYQAKFLKYLHNRGLQDTEGRKVWAFCGDGEMDEPESTGALTIAAREKLDNLVFVVSCNLQKLDGPVAGNDQVVSLLSKSFQGAGWNVIKVLWGSDWDDYFEHPAGDLLVKTMNETVDGEYQNLRANDGAYIREKFFHKHPKLAEMVSDVSDEHLLRLRRGGHDPLKVNAAYHKAMTINNGKPTVILAKTVKGFDLLNIQGSNNAHNIKKMTEAQLMAYRDKLQVPLTDKQAAAAEFYHPGKEAPEIQYMLERRRALGGFLPARREKADETLTVPALEDKMFSTHLEGSDGREISTNMAFSRIFTSVLRDKELKKRLVPIVPDECRTLALEGLFPKIGLYSVVGQKYEPVDSGQLIYYKESQKGQIINEGLTEDGAMCEMIAAGTSYSVSNYQMMPFYVYYSMFGFQRVGDLAWAAGDAKMRGFMVGSLAGRTSLPGEGLQHLDGQSHNQAAVIPSCISYDPTWGYEIAVIMQDGMRRMMTEQEDIFYYLTVGNEKYAQMPMPVHVKAQDVLKGLYCYQPATAKKDQVEVQLLSSGGILREALVAAELLAKDFDIAASVWSAISFNQLGRDAAKVQRWNMRHPEKAAKQAYVSEQLLPTKGAIVAATDYMKTYAEQIRECLQGKHYVTLGTDGYGRSDTRANLRSFFEVDAAHIAYAAVKALVDAGELPAKTAVTAFEKYGIDADKPNPVEV